MSEIEPHTAITNQQEEKIVIEKGHKECNLVEQNFEEQI